MPKPSALQVDDESNPYLVARQQRIQRNQAVLIGLGLPAAPSCHPISNRPQQQRTRSLASGPVRRSKRQLPATEEQPKETDK